MHEVVEPAIDHEGLWSPKQRPLTIGLVLTITLVAAEALAVATAMPVVAEELGGLELYGLVFTSFLVASLLSIVVAGTLIDRRGVVFPFVIGITLFAIGLAIAGSAQSMPMLIAGRFIQGLGGGAIPPISFVAIGRTLPERLRPQMFATLSTAWVLPGVLGPGIAGVVAEAFSWRLIFFGLLPLLAVSGFLAYRGLTSLHPDDQGPTVASDGQAAAMNRGRIANGLLIALGIGIVNVALAGDLGIERLALGAVGLGIALFAFARLMPPGTLTAARGYPTAILLRGILTFAFFAVDVYVALLLEDVRGWSPFMAGIAITAATVSWTVGSWTQARFSSRFPHEWFVRRGFPVVALGLAGLGLILLQEVPAVLAIPIFGLAGYGMGLAYAQFALIVLRDVPREDQGTATANLTLSDQVGTTLGTSVAAVLVHTAVASTGSPASGLAVAIVIGSAVAVGGWLLAPRLRNPEPAIRHAEPAPALR
ncbi:MAG TPA: MFS transporter [Candidatus Limnocylindrales bacterium]|nr:MFS transporter [Candidatus Limnocylindrales bacterium]